MTKNKYLISIILNIVISILGFIGVIEHYMMFGFGMFVFYTLDSNLLLIIASTILAICEIVSYKNNTPIPKIAKVIKYIATCTVTLTFLGQ